MTIDTTTLTARPVEAAAEHGFPHLAAALAAADIDAIAVALRDGRVIAPIIDGPEGSWQYRVGRAGEGAPKPLELFLFSSTETLWAWISESPEQRFVVPLGSDVAAFLDLHADVLDRVIFDPAGPHTVAVTLEALQAAFQEALTAAKPAEAEPRKRRQRRRPLSPLDQTPVAQAPTGSVGRSPTSASPRS
jgi:hypothetical protein